MKFSEIYKLYKLNRVSRNIPDLPELQCHTTKLDILFNTLQIEHDEKIDVGYYIAFMDTLGDHNANPAYIAFEVYIKQYAHQFERDIRRRFVGSGKLNAQFCQRYNIPSRYHNLHFGNLAKHSEQNDMAGVVKDWVRKGFTNSIVLQSRTRGIGKTTMLVCAMHEYYIEYDYKSIPYWRNIPHIHGSICFIKERELMYAIRQSYSSDAQFSENEIIDKLCAVDFLVYDDLFSVSDGDFAKRILFNIVDRRVECEGKSTAFSTTYPKEKLKGQQPDIYDRLQRGVFYVSNINKSFRNNDAG